MDNINISDYNYDAIKYFISVAKYGSLSRAAKFLGISQSALSQSMKNLEQSLGVVLFNRNTRGIILTDEGRVLYQNAIKGNECFKNAIIETLRLKTFKDTKLCKISCSNSLTSLLITPKMRILKDKLSNINIEFCNTIRDSKVVENLQSGNYDVVILKGNKDFNIKEVEVKKLCTLNYVFAYNPQYFDLPECMSFNQVSNYPIILKERDGQNDNSWLKFSVDKYIECKSDNQCLEMIKNGAGIGFYPKEMLEKENLKMLNIENFSPTKRIVYVCFLSYNKTANTIVEELLKF